MVRGAPSLTGLLVASGLYTLGYGAELIGVSLEWMVVALRFQYLGMVFLPMFLVLFALHFTGRGRSPWPGVILAGVSLAFLVLVITEDHHQLFHYAWGSEPLGPLRVLVFRTGPAYWVFVAYFFLSGLATSSGLLVFCLGAPPPQRRQAFTVAAGVGLPIVAGLVYHLALPSPRLDLVPFALVVTGLTVSWALVRMGMVGLVPAARHRAVDALKEALVVFDRRGLTADWNPAAAALFGGEHLRFGERPSGPLSLLVEGPSPVQTRLQVEGRECTVEGESFFVLNHRDQPTGVCWIFRDTSRHTELIDRLQDQADRDALTGLLNRRSFFARAQQAFFLAQRESRPLTVLLIDLDHFKVINDTRGHQKGDGALISVATSLAHTLRDSDLLARYGGEEFVVLFSGAEVETACRVAQRMLDAVRRDSSGELPLTASCGVCCAVPAEGDTLDLFVNRADEALYASKAAGRDRLTLWTGR